MFVLYIGGGVSEDDGALLSENYLFVNMRVCMHVSVCAQDSRKSSQKPERDQIYDLLHTLRRWAACLLGLVLSVGLLPALEGAGCQPATRYPLPAVQTVNGPQSFHLAWTPPACNNASSLDTKLIG